MRAGTGFVPVTGSGLDEEILATRTATVEAAATLEAAATRARQTRRLKNKGLSARDSAAILGVLAPRVSQFLNR